MSLAPRLDLRQSQSLVMTPQLQQAIKLLALSNLEIETFLGEALENNPLLEAGDLSVEATVATPDPSAGAASAPAERSSEPPLDSPAARDEPAEHEDDRDSGDWSAQRASGESDEGLSVEDRGAGEPTLAEHLDAQIGAVAADPRELFLARHLIGLLDEAGYLTIPLAEVAEDMGVSLTDAERALGAVQSLDPTGVGARTLAECLALQAQEADRYDPCMATLIAHLELVAKGDFARLKRMCRVDEEDFADMLRELRSYDPKPGLRFGGGERAPLVPDILVTSRGSQWDIALNPATLPRLVVNRSYYLELSSCGDPAAKGWLGEKLADANWLIRALDQRQKTILKVAAEVVKQQEGFFRHGIARLKPLTLRTVAEAIEMHESTVSRVTSNKSLQCDRGTFELKYFFTSGVAATDGEGAVSAASVKAQIRALVDAEDPGAILSDDTLVELLREKGFDLARRTVAKYREAIGIGSSVQRRRQKRLAGRG